ncbi:single-stranded-DNA-specific exonuclease RecJ [Candidatus Dojkabacteria bacterium]|nr:single-stranded-DNA-specific exonuclease RecJ [Candidatus Dojkabacteria bacterium]
MIMNFRWNINKTKLRHFEDLKDLDPIIHKLLSILEIKDSKEAYNFLNPSEQTLQEPTLFMNSGKIINYLRKAIQKKKKIFIHGDFDVDGITATSILWDFLFNELGADVLPIIPNRFEEGYGLSEKSIDRIVKQDGEIVITVDCGIKDIELIKNYPAIDFIITDHHTYPKTKSGKKKSLKADNLIGVFHPQHPKSKLNFTQISGTTVAWKLICVLNEKINNNEFSPNIYLPYVAMATIADIMPLKDENRYLVKRGLEKMNTSTPLAINSLMQISGIENSEINSYHIGYIIGPRLNAAGRLEDATESVRLLCTKNKNKSKKIASHLDNLNKKRQELTSKYLEKAQSQIEKSKEDFLFFIHGVDWPEGILGLIAGRIQEKYSKPTLVSSLNSKKNIIKGSARSIKSYNVTDAIKNFENLLVKFGGHAQAAGFSLLPSNLDKFKKSIIEHANTNISQEELIPIINIAEKVQLNDVNFNFIKTIQKLAPFGFGNPRPLFLIENLRIISKKNVGRNQSHIQLLLSNKGKQVKSIGFRLADDFKKTHIDDRIDVVCNPTINEWKGFKNVQLEIKDFRISKK